MSGTETKILHEVVNGLYPLVGAHLMTSAKMLKFDIYDNSSTKTVNISVVETGPGSELRSVDTRITYEMIKNYRYPELNEMVLTGLIKDLIGIDTYNMLLKIIDENTDRITIS